MSNRRSVVSAAVTAALLSTAYVIPLAASAAETGQQDTQLEEIVVTGFRGSLNTALAEKRAETAAIDVIAAEDIGKFPDSNLAESMQRIPGVTLSRGDGGEGRNISVRGLGPLFTRVRINGMEAAAQTGSSDIYGAGNNGRSFDFNVFPTEIFSQLAVRKTPSANVEEGSLGATVDLKAPHPFDFEQDRVFTLTGRGVFNTISEDLDPRASMLFSQKFFDNTFGVLASAAFQKRNIREVGYSAVDILSANTNANNLGTNANPILLPYCTPIGWTATAPSPVLGERGSTATNCSARTARASELDAFNTVYNLRRASAPNTPGSGAFLPRLPRYVNSEQDTERTGGTLSLQWKPNENTDIALDGLLSRYQVERRDNYILGLSFGRNLTNSGQPMVAVRDISFDQHGSVEYAVFDGVDVRSEGLVDQFVSTFEQANLTFEHRFNDKFKITGLAGRSNSIWDGPMRLQTFLDAIDVPNFTLDFRGGRETPLIGFGMDVNNPELFQYAPTPDGNRTVLGGFSTQGKPSRNVTQIANFDLAGEWQATDQIALTLGGQYRENDFHARNSNLVPSQVPVTALPNGVSVADISTQITDLDDLFGSGAPASWVAVDSKKWRDVFNFADMDFCGVECGANESGILEKVTSGFFQFSFDSGSDWRFPVRGDIGVRYVKTDQTAVGHIPVNAPAGAPFPTVGQRNQVDREYSDTLPSLNVVVDLTPDLLARFSAAKVMSRPELGNLTPTATITATTRTGTVNNPFLDPIRAKTADLGLEWYFRPGSLLSVAYFYKDIETYIQRITSPVVYTELGLPDALLAGTPASPTDVFNVSRLENTDGGPLKGFELNAQLQLDMLPGIWSHFGVLANYTRVESEIEYILTSSGGVVTSSTTADLVGLSKNSASGTLFYDDGVFSIRTTGTYRDKYIRGIPASAGSDLQGNGETFYLDAAASWNFNDYLTLILEAQNLTEERNTLFIDSVREDTLFQTDIGRTYTLGATIKF
ncbi:TonB-dependent receptor [Steroidobacter agaridevorans]|uniref:TonB-dependent receptor n=1 Tax=Steroidobacter agaridevorans TaxID=2695856 RepID=A0A829YLU4_9GAMM|nr:TonB-dependent receptor [Steroidobacter agaridevorans]GFE84169.1 TonB-dependent receptor [Steroidobacter agaridevorans]GFE86991.1 TonB-dependent receptor [Steroidobacter agaridevorans]